MPTATNQFTFADGELTVSISSSIKPPLKAVSLPIGEVNMQPPSGFQPIRVVANIAIEEAASPGNYLTTLPGAIQIKVKYRLSDRQAAGSRPLVLAFWDGSAWIPFTAAKHNFKLTAYADPNKGGYATLTLRHWGDPPITWGT